MSMPRAPKSGDPVFALAEVVKFHREERNWTHRQVATVCGTNIATVEAWEKGLEVPTSDQWGKLKRAVNHNLRYYTELYHAAKAATIPGQTPDRQVSTNLGEKMRAAQISIVPAPADAPVEEAAPPPTELPPVPDVEEEEYSNPLGLNISTALRALPEGWKTLEERRRRRDWVREEFVRDPDQPISHVLRRAREKFGVGVRERDIAEIKEEVEEIMAAMKRVGEPETPVAQITPVPTRDPSQDLATAVELLLAAIPNLARLTVQVDAQGNTSVDYLTREVKVVETAGSLNLPKK